MFYQFIQMNPNKNTYPWFNTLSLRYISEIYTLNKRKPVVEKVKASLSPNKRKLRTLSVDLLSKSEGILQSCESKDLDKSIGQFDNDDDFESFKEIFVVKPYFMSEEDYNLLVNKDSLEEVLETKFPSNFLLFNTYKKLQT